MALTEPLVHSVTAKQIHPEKTGERIFTAHASDAALPPGEWPFFLTIIPARAEAEGVAFRRKARIVHETSRAFLGYEYQSKGGITLRLLND